ncbi:MAG: flagellar motor switch protein FliG [Planctomycetota bacterium]|nr:MAG: flagellar motor switch protein FliG [Planctomycetota bacterium]
MSDVVKPEGADQYLAGMPGPRRAAALLLTLDPETAASVMRNLSDGEVASISEEMSRMGTISGDEMERVIEAYRKQVGTGTMQVEPMLEQLLEKALGREKARVLISRIRSASRDSEPFKSLRNLNHRQVSSMLKGEHPQVVALVVTHLPPEVAIDVLKSMDEEPRYEVIRRIATTDELPIDLVRQVDNMLEVRAYEMARQSTDSAAERRYKTIAQMLNFAEPSVAKSVMDKMTKDLPSAAAEIQALMFVFEDLVRIDDRTMQKILGEVDKADLTLSLKTAAPEVKDKLLGNLSQRAREAILDELEFMGPRSLSDVEEAQKRILDQVREMEERGDIVISRGGGEVMV